MRFPIDGAFRIGYGFGPRGNIGVPGASTNHEGIDIVRPNSGLPVGTPVRCPLDGKVLIAGNSGGGAGYTTLTEHKHNGTTYRIRINHYSKWNVQVGQKVKEGDILGRSGGQPGQPGAGSSGGPHCHVGVYKVVNGRAVPIDPGPFFGLGSTRGIGSTKPGKTFPAFAGGGGTVFTPPKPPVNPEPTPVDEEEEEDMPKNSGVATQRGTDRVWLYLVFNYGSGLGHEFNSGSSKPVDGAIINEVAKAFDTTPWAEVSEQHYNVIKRSLNKVAEINVNVNG